MIFDCFIVYVLISKLFIGENLLFSLCTGRFECNESVDSKSVLGCWRHLGSPELPRYFVQIFYILLMMKNGLEIVLYELHLSNCHCQAYEKNNRLPLIDSKHCNLGFSCRFVPADYWEVPIKSCHHVL